MKALRSHKTPRVIAGTTSGEGACGPRYLALCCTQAPGAGGLADGADGRGHLEGLADEIHILLQLHGEKHDARAS